MITTSVTLPGDSHKINLLRALKGAPLSCLHALYLAHPTPLDRTQLCLMTDYGKDEITHAMRLLCDLHGFATRLGRYAGWILTSVGAQLHLPGFPVLERADSGEIRTDVPRALGEGDFSAFPNGSSSSLYISSSIDLLQTTTTTTTTEREGDFSAFPTDAKPAIDLLPSEANDLIETYLRGCKRATSQHAVRAALARGDTLADIEAEMIAWVMYAESPLGKGIRSPAIHAVSKIKDGEKCPEFLFRVDEKDRACGDAWRKWLDANKTWIARLYELQTPAFEPPAPAARVPEFAEAVSADVLIPNDAPEPTFTDARAVEIWNAARVELQLQMTKATFDTWVKPAFAIAYDRERAELVIGVRNPYAKQWLENRLYGMIERTVRHVVGIATQIKFTHVSAAA